MKLRSETFLTNEEERLLLRIARTALETWVREERRLDLSGYSLTPALRESHGAFVTLRRGGELRGCIGYTTHGEPLAEAVRDNAINASSRDPRFDPVTEDELPEIVVEVSALSHGDTPDTPFRRVSDISEIVIGRDGLYIERPPYRGGILLPQVATDHDWDVGQFLAAVCRKAGYPDRAWELPNARLYRFSAQVFSEADLQEEA
ncbi:MAG: AmmeMemoRadiSam system protein A [Candidatus Hydrogenedentes bacterium]|nr:AmmeMemoRadiSam system protein A [Candidatus Hydrogenedentota bacterium]